MFYREGRQIVGYKKLHPETKEVVCAVADPYASERIDRLQQDLLAALAEDSSLGDGLLGVECVSTDNASGSEVLFQLAYGRPFEEDALKTQLRPLLSRLDAAGVVALAKKQRLVVGSESLVQWNAVGDRHFPQMVAVGHFSQTNLHVCREMQTWAAERAGGGGGDLLELCCGNGNFTLPLAGAFGKVLATERDQVPVANARHCAQLAGVDNITFVRLKAEEVVEAFSPGGRRFRRLRDAGVDVADCNFGTVFANPPRAGLDAKVLILLSRADRCMYFSCSPRTLARDIRRLPGHRVVAAALFDQFPFTLHAEVGVLLERQPS